MDSGAPAQRRGSAAQPSEIGGFEILAPLGRGGMGVVYRARDPVTGDGVAVKTVLWSGEGALAAIRREILALSAIRHPGVVKVLAEGVRDGRPWYAMELIEGQSLRQHFASMWKPAMDAHTTMDARVSSVNSSAHSMGLEATVSGTEPSAPYRKRTSDTQPEPFVAATQAPGSLAAPPELRELLELVLEMCDPLAHVHAAGIVHRDLTPDNIIVRHDGTPVLVDFGLASSFRRGGREALAVGGTIVGTTHYMSPEQIRGELVDARADLYSLGCILYEALCGRPPFLGASASGILSMHLYEAPVPPSARDAAVPLWLNSLVLGLLAKDPRARIGYAGDVAALVRRALGAAAPERDAPPYVYRPRMIGRADEVGRFDRIQARLRDGKGGVVLVRGESGVGKTRLAVELATRASSEGVRVVVAECPPVIGAERAQSRAAPLAPLKPFLQAVADRCIDQGDDESARLLGERGRVLATYEPAIARLPFVVASQPPPSLTVEGTRARLFQYLRETVRAMASPGPLLLLVDDIQWADELTLRFLLSLRSELFAATPVLVMCTQRSEEPSALVDELAALPSTDVIELPRLDTAAIHTMIADMLALPDIPPALVASLVGPSAGVPFHAGEYLRAAVEDGILVRKPGTPWALAGGSADETLPTSLTELLRHRLDRLGAAGRTLAALAAVVGREFDADLLAELTGTPADEMDDTLRDMVRRHIFEEAAGGKLRFGHDKIREVAYDGLADDDRRRAHRDAARALEQRVSTQPSHDLYPVLAHHYSMADEPARAVEFLEKAGQRALEIGGYQDTIDFLRRALTLTERGAAPATRGRRGRWRRMLGEAAWGLGDIDGCGEHFAAALGDLDRPVPQTTAGWLRDAGRRIAGQVARNVLRLPARAGDPDAAEAALAAARISYHYYHRGENLRMVASTLRAVDLADRADPDARVADTYQQFGYIAGLFRMGKVAEHYFTAAQERARATGDDAALGLSLYSQATYWYGLGQVGLGLRFAEDSVELLRRIGHTHEIEVALSVVAHMQHSLGRHEDALACSQELYESARARNNGMHESWGAYTCARELIRLGHLDDAIALLSHARELARAAGDRASLVLLGGLRALADVERGDVEATVSVDEWLGLVGGTTPSVYSLGHGYAAAAEASLRLLEAAPDDARARRRARATIANLWRYAMMFPVGRVPAFVCEAWSQRLAGRPRLAHRLATAGLARARAYALPYEQAMAERELAALES
jgi:serine/threonine protein kinase/tetratricopeptide (TPR) repeat protein